MRQIDDPARYYREYRAARVKSGTCGWCANKLGRFKWLCDDCAKKHRDRQRNKKV